MPEPLGLREEGPDLEKQGAGDKDSWTEDGEAGGPELPSSLTIFLEQRNVSAKGLLLLLQHPEQLLHEELTWEEAGWSRVVPAPPPGVSYRKCVSVCRAWLSGQ